ncbi:MAG TPA: wax ester/triacylglycerol synthase family O-acyltransferase [Alphaproteobacteria bacterium]|nr:wax ester/triacylglycerol synthase family O-acyltransferase [Alphaproteobacteria bacterium]
MTDRSDSSPDAAFEPLSGMDAGFLYMETPTLHMHTLKVAILDTSQVPGGLSFESFRRHLAPRLERIPAFKQRLAYPLFALTHPVWVPDAAFDVDRHIAHRHAPEPGGMAALRAVVGDVASRPLPRDRPLWEITFVDRLGAGRVAFVCKLHHAMADGSAVLGMLFEAIKAPRPRPPAEGAGAGDLVPSRAGMPAKRDVPPSRWTLARWAVRRVLAKLLELPALLGRTLWGLRALRTRAREGGHPALPAAFSGPRTAWNHALTARRSFATATLPMDDLLRVRRSLGVTLNDVFLGVCSGALRAHLEASEGGLPSESLTASVPVNTRPDLAGRMRGNHVGHLTALLCSDMADPVERIRSIHRLMAEAKERHESMGRDLMERWSEFVPPIAFASTVRFWSGRHMADIVPPPVSLIVSNVPGPREEVVFGGMKLEALYSVGPILEGIGLNITGWSYAGRMYVVGLACPDQIEDVQALVDGLEPALAEVLRACEPRGVESPGRITPAREPAKAALAADEGDPTTGVA